MSVRHIPYQSKLSKLIRSAGGKSVSEAVKAADANVMTVAAAGLAVLDRKTEEIRVLVAGSRDAATLAELYKAADEIGGLAGQFGLPDLTGAAYSLCELIDQADGTWPSLKSVQVHVDALRLLRLGEAAPAAERERVLGGLRDVVRRAKAA